MQVARRLRALLTGLLDIIDSETRRQQVRDCLAQLNLNVALSDLDQEDRAKPLQENRQGLGLSRGAGRPAAVPRAAAQVEHPTA